MIGDVICKLRKERNISQGFLGDYLNLSASAVGMYEQNRRLPDTDTLISLCEFFSVSADYILELKDDKDPYPKSTVQADIKDRICLLMKEQGVEIDFVASVSNIRKRRLLDVINGGKKPDATELRSLSACFGESSDFILGITDTVSKQTYTISTDDTFAGRLSRLMDGENESAVADALNIPAYKLKKLLSGEEVPTIQILCDIACYFKKSTDYLLALSGVSREALYDNSYPFDILEVSLQRIQEVIDINDFFPYENFGITEQELYNLYNYGFIPHVTVLRKICEYKHVSSDYILGLSNSKLSICYDLNLNEDDLLKSYRKLSPTYRKKVDGFVADQIIQQDRDNYMKAAAEGNSESTNNPLSNESVAADSLKEAK